MKIGMYMYDREIELNDEATDEFLNQHANAMDTMKRMLTAFEDEETRQAMFFMMSLRTLIDDFIEFCAEDITADEMEILLNNNDLDFLDEYEEDGENEMLVEFDDEEE